jgi:ATP-dependent RNA helicase DDX10/DBP4
VKIRFSDLPISKASVNGLFKAKFVKLTDVQRATVPHGIAGRDLVVCARTGSGKTLCYLLSMIERLF